MVILDMEMPKSCADCDLRDTCDNCSVTWEDVANAVDDEVIAESCPIKAEIPKDATNGDVIKVMFPWIAQEKDYKDLRVSVLPKGFEKHMRFDMSWWNAPWKGKVGGENE